MNGEQFFDLLGDLDEGLILAAARPPKRSRPINAWLLAAAAAVVIGVIGYAGLMRAWQSPPPVEPVTPTTKAPLIVTASTESTTATATAGHDTTTSLLPSTATVTEEAHGSTTFVIVTTTAMGETTTSTTADPTATVTTQRPTGPDTLAPTSAAPSVSGTQTTTSQKRPPYSCTTTTTPSSTVAVNRTTMPVTKGTMPNGLPVLNSDYEVETDRLNGYTEFVFGYSFEELQVQSIATAPSVLPVYMVGEKRYERDSLTDIIEKYSILTDDTRVSGIYDDGKSADFTGVKFRYHINRGEGNYIMLSLNKPIALGTPDQWLGQVTAYCPALFKDMQKPTLHRWNGSRWWNKKYTDSPAIAQQTVTFYARIYDAAAVTDAASKWLDGVSLKIEDGKLTALCVMFEENYQKLGDYPILSVAEATALAREQCETLKAYPHYSIISENYEILSTELVYMPHSASGLRVPLYRFLVTTDGADYMAQLRAETGMTMYYAVYVTAVPPSYWTPESRDRFITQK